MKPFTSYDEIPLNTPLFVKTDKGFGITALRLHEYGSRKEHEFDQMAVAVIEGQDKRVHVYLTSANILAWQVCE